MDGTLWYGNGGAGIFQHSSGAFDTYDPVQATETARGFQGLGSTPATVASLRQAALEDLPAAGPITLKTETENAWTRMSSTSKGVVIGGAVLLVVILGSLALRGSG